MTASTSFWIKFRADELVAALTLLLIDAIVVLTTYILSYLNGNYLAILVGTNSKGEFWFEFPFVVAAVPLGAYALWRALVRMVAVDTGASK